MEKLKKDMHSISKVMFLLLILQAFITMHSVKTFGTAPYLKVPFASELIPVATLICLAGAFLDIVVLAILGIKGFLEAAAPSRNRWHIIIAYLSCGLFSLSFIGSFTMLFSTAELFRGICITLLQALLVFGIADYIRKARSLRAAAC